MKAISLWQPWASLIANGAKKIETRSWPTNYRGPILIHAAKRKNKGEMLQIAGHSVFRAALGVSVGDALEHINNLPYGAIVAVAKLVDCKPVEQFTLEELDTEHYRCGDHFTERWLGNYEYGRFGWVLGEVRPLTPIPYKGEQGLFWIPEDVVIR